MTNKTNNQRSQKMTHQTNNTKANTPYTITKVNTPTGPDYCLTVPKFGIKDLAFNSQAKAEGYFDKLIDCNKVTNWISI